MCLYGACVWHIWDMVIRLCSYGGIYMCVQCMIYYIISWVHIKGGYIIRVHITEGNIWVACIQHRSYKVVAYKVVHIRYCAYKVVAYKVVAYTTWTIQACAYDRVYYLICYYLYRYAIAYKGVCAPCMHRWYIVCMLMCMYCVQSISICVSIYRCIMYVCLCVCLCVCIVCLLCVYVYVYSVACTLYVWINVLCSM